MPDHDPIRHPNSSNAAAAAVPPAVSRSVPRLADFRLADKSSLISPVIVSGALRAIEFLLVAVIGLLIAAFYVHEDDAFGTRQYLVALAGTSLALVGLAELFGLYARPALTAITRQLPRLLLAWTLALGLLVASVFLLKIGPDFSRVWLVAWYVTGASALVVTRFVTSILVRRWARAGRLNLRAVVYGSGPAAHELIRALEEDAGNDIRICGIFDERGDDRTRRMISGYPLLGGIEDLLAFGRNARLDLVLVALPMTAEERLIDIVRRLWVLPVDIRLAATATKVRFPSRAYSYIGKVPMIDLADRPIKDWGMVAKWIFDKAVGVTALFLLAPVMAAIALAIRLDSKGPILFRQKRYGFNNELIEVLKFRSMYVDKCDAEASRLVTKSDDRVTRVGRFIRKTSLDELPQLLNVVKGDLSLVGPRPHALAAKAADKLYDEVVDSYFARHKVKPGITGWAQINGWRGETDTPEKIEKRVEHDLYYIENWSLLLDVYILLMTPVALLKTDNAY